MKAELQTWHKGVRGLSFFGCGYAPPGSSVLLTRKSFAGRKGFFFAKSSRSSRLRGESWAGLSPRRREAREENAKGFSLVASLLLCVITVRIGQTSWLLWTIFTTL